MELGNLWFGVDLKDKIKDSDINKMREKIQKGLKESVKISVDAKDISRQIQASLKSEVFNIKLGFDEDELRRKISATVSRAGSNKFTASDLRAVKAQTLLAQSEERLNGLRAQTRQRTANAESAEERLAAARARTQAANNRLQQSQRQLNEALSQGSKSAEFLNSTLAKLGGVTALTLLGRQIVKTAGDFQFMEAAITSLVGSEREGAELMEQLKDFARISPLEVKDVTKAAQTLLGFNVELSKVPDMIQRLGDVSMGNKDRFNALTLAFAQTTSAARLTGEDLRQYVNAGFNPLQVMAERTGKTMRELKDEMSRGAISVQMVEQAFIDATSAGGKFYRMSEKQSDTINGQLAKLGDTIDRTLNEIGRANENLITGGISLTSKLITNYEQIGRIILGLATTYGVYRTAVLLATAAENGYTIATGLAKIRILAVAKAQAILNATMLSNPYVLAATALGAVVGALIAANDGMTAAERAQRNFNDALAEASEKQKEFNAETEQAISVANDDTAATGSRREALNLLISRYGDIMQKYIDEKGHLKDILQLKKEIAIIDGNRNVESLNAKAGRYNDAAEATKQLISGKPLSKSQLKLIEEMKDEYFGENGFWAKAWYNDNDLLDWSRKMAGEYGKKARREAAVNAATRFQDTIAAMNDAQLEALQKLLKTAKQKKGNVVMKAYKELANVTLTQEDIDKLTTYAGGITESRKPKARTKHAIEEDKKAAQAQLDALTVAEANGKKGAELRKKILGYTKELEAYNPKASNNTGMKAGEAAEKLVGMQMEQAQKIRRATTDLELSTRQAEIGAMEKGTEQSVKLIELDHDKRLEAIRREYEDLRNERIKAAKELWDADPSHKGVNFYQSEEYKKAATQALTDEQKRNQAAKTAEANKLYADALARLSELETQQMYDYLEKYGSVQQMRLAIKEDYDRRIAKSSDKWQKKQLEKERDEAIDRVTGENLLKQVDLSSIFSEYGVILSAPLERTLQALKDYTKTESFAARSFEDQKVVFDTIGNVERQLGTIGGVSFSEIGRNIYDYNNAIISYKNASEQLAEASQESILAQAELDKAKAELAKATTDEARETAKRAKEAAEGRVNVANANYNAKEEAFNLAQNALVAAQGKASDSLKSFQISIERVGNIASAVAGGSMRQLWNALGQRTQKRIGEFVTGTHSYSKAIELASSSLAKQGKGMDYFVSKVGDVAAEIYESGEKISEAGIGGKITALLDKIFGDDSKKLGSLGDKLTKILDKTLNKSRESGDDTGNAVKKAVNAAISEISKNGGSLWTLIIGTILDLLDILKEGIGALIETILTKVGDAIDGILSEIGSGRFFENIAHGVSNIATGIIKGVANLFSGGAAFGGSNVDEMEEEIAELAKANEALAKSIDSLSETIKNNDSTNSQSNEAYKRALKAEKEWEENQRKAINDRASEWSNSGHGWLKLGGKHSFNAYVNDRGADWEGWKSFNKALREGGYNAVVQSAQDIWNLSPEMMRLLRDYAPKAWAELLSSDGESNPSELIDEYIAKAGKIDELTSALNEKLTGYSWDAFKSSYVDLLKDLESTNENFAEKLEDMLTNAILNSLVNEVYKDRIKALYEMIANAASDESEGGTEMTQNELQAIRAANDALSEDLLKARKNLIDAGILKDGGSSSSSSSVSGGIKGITEQTADLLASYINGMRADLSVIRQGVAAVSLPGGMLNLAAPVMALQATITPQIATIVMQGAQLNSLAQTQVQLQTQIYERVQVISEHTAALSRIEESVRNSSETLRKVTTGTEKLHVK